MSLGARLVNVFAAPGELFSAIAAVPFSVANWLVPVFLVAAIGLVVTLVTFSNPALAQQVLEMQERGIEKAVAEGKMTAEQAEQAGQAMQGMGLTIMRVLGSIWSVGSAFVAPFWWAFLFWLAALAVFRARVGFMKVVEVTALTSLIGGLGMIVGMFLQIGTGNLGVGPHLATFVEKLDMMSRVHIALLAANAFNFWQVVAASVGMARLTGRPFGPVAAVVIGVWAGYKAIAVSLGLVQFAI